MSEDKWGTLSKITTKFASPEIIDLLHIISNACSQNFQVLPPQVTHKNIGSPKLGGGRLKNHCIKKWVQQKKMKLWSTKTAWTFITLIIHFSWICLSHSVARNSYRWQELGPKGACAVQDSCISWRSNIRMHRMPFSWAASYTCDVNPR